MKNVWKYKPYFMSWLQAFVYLVVLSISSQAANLKVRCGGRFLPNTINGALKLLPPQGPNTVTVSGTCNENVLIHGFNRLTLISTTGGTISDASGGTDVVVYIDDSTVAFQGLTINGGIVGVNCFNLSVCRFDGNTVQGASVVGIQFATQSRGTLGANTIQNNGIGLVVIESSSVRSFGGLVIQENLGTGVWVDASSFASYNDTIQRNGGDGITLDDHGVVVLGGTTATGNFGQGVAVLGHSAVNFLSDNVVTGNGYDGVLVRDASYAAFSGISTITGNLILDVECQPQFPVTRGVLTNIGGGTTNCTEPLTPEVGREVHGQVGKPTR